MKLNKNKTAFGRHETFPLRYGWLTKGFEAIEKEKELFHNPEQAMIRLGIGRNMVNALHYWLQVTGIVTFTQEGGEASELGRALLGEHGDRYLEDEATLWIVHWLIAANAEMATGFFWFFNHYALPRFRDKDALAALEEFVSQHLGIKRSHSTLKSDLSTLLRMYAPVAHRGGDDHLDSPLASLQLVTAEEGYGYSSLRSLHPFLPPVAMHFALQQRFRAEKSGTSNEQAAIPIRDLLYGGNGWAAPGAVFRLSEEGFMASLQQVMEAYPQHYRLSDTAGLNQLYCLKTPQTSKQILNHYYQGHSAWAA